MRTAVSPYAVSYLKPDPMRTLLPLLLLVCTAQWTPLRACSCFGPNTFCGTLNPPYEEPEWWIPEAVVLAVPLETYYYGIDVVIIQVFQGEVDNDTVRVWGDNGALCRLYAGWEPGDTLVIGIDRTDLAGNTIINPEYPEGLERPEDYMISGCGVYALDYTDGRVSGWITAPTMQNYSLEEFEETINACALSNGIDAPNLVDPLVVRTVSGTLLLELLNCSSAAQLIVLDMQGRCVLRRRWDGSSLELEGMASGTYVAEVIVAEERWRRKVMVE